jgi:hypothetical protein
MVGICYNGVFSNPPLFLREISPRVQVFGKASKGRGRPALLRYDERGTPGADVTHQRWHSCLGQNTSNCGSYIFCKPMSRDVGPPVDYVQITRVI